MNRLGVMYVRCLTAAFLAHLEYTPHILDKERVEQEYKRVSSRRDEIEERMKEITGGINLNSNDQLAEFLYDKLGFSPPSIKGKPIVTPKGKFKTDTATLALLKASNKKQTEFLELFKEYNKCESLLSKCLDFFLRICEEKDSKMYFQFNQGRVVSHRLSSTGVAVIAGRGAPQGQNIPREYKKLHTVPQYNDGFKWYVGEADGSQLEFRVGVQLSHDKQGMEDIRNGVDVHANTAAAYLAAKDPLFVATPDPKERRQLAKSRSFKPMYGGTGTTAPEKAYKEFFSKRYSGLAAMQKGWCYEALRAQDHGVRMPWGIVYYFPDVKMESSGYIRGTTNIYNYGIDFCPFTLRGVSNNGVNSGKVSRR